MGRKRKYEKQVNEDCRNFFGTIYKIENLINGKIYIGQTTTSLYDRFCSHVSSSNKNNFPLCRAIAKYGYENFSIKNIDHANNKYEMNEKEKYWIEKLNSKNKKIGYNVQSGGQNDSFPHKPEDLFKLRMTRKSKKEYMGVSKNKKNFVSYITISGKQHMVYEIKDKIFAMEIYDHMARFYLGKYAVLNFPEINLEPLSINDCRKLVRYVNHGILYNGVSRKNNKYYVRMKINYKEVVNICVNSQIDAAYIYDYYNRLHNFDKYSINFPNILLSLSDVEEIIGRNRKKAG